MSKLSGNIIQNGGQHSLFFSGMSLRHWKVQVTLYITGQMPYRPRESLTLLRQKRQRKELAYKMRLFEDNKLVL